MKKRSLCALCLLLASLACNALNNFANIPGPEETATDVVVTATGLPPTAAKTAAPTPTAVPAPTEAGSASATPAATDAAAPSATPAAQDLPFTLDSAADEQA